MLIYIIHVDLVHGPIFISGFPTVYYVVLDQLYIMLFSINCILCCFTNYILCCLVQLYIMLFWANCILCCFGPTVYYVVLDQLYIMLFSTNCILCWCQPTVYYVVFKQRIMLNVWCFWLAYHSATQMLSQFVYDVDMCTVTL